MERSMVDNIATTGSNLLVNGSFEATALGVGKAAGFQSIAGWTALTGGTIELWNNAISVTATQGVNIAELDYLGGYDGFYQDVGTTAGQAYTLSFDLRSRPGYAISTQGVEVVWNDQVVATTYPGTAWSTFSVNVNGTGGQDRLTIREVQGQSGDGIGALLDNFRLVAGDTPNQQPANTLLSLPTKRIGRRSSISPTGSGSTQRGSCRLVIPTPTAWAASPSRWTSGRDWLDLWKLAEKDNLWSDYVGSRSSGPRTLPDRDHQGVPGIRSTEVVGLSTQLATTYRPDVVLLMLGTNDALNEQTV